MGGKKPSHSMPSKMQCTRQKLSPLALSGGAVGRAMRMEEKALQEAAASMAPAAITSRGMHRPRSLYRASGGASCGYIRPVFMGRHRPSTHRRSAKSRESPKRRACCTPRNRGHQPRAVCSFPKSAWRCSEISIAGSCPVRCVVPRAAPKRRKLSGAWAEVAGGIGRCRDDFCEVARQARMPRAQAQMAGRAGRGAVVEWRRRR